jgi:hypothetical protein
MSCRNDAAMQRGFKMSDEKKIEARKKTAPYLPFKTFMNSLDTFAHGLPGILDRTIWRSQAGVTQGLIMNTYRFFGLVDEYDSPTDALETMVRHTEQRPMVLRGLIEATYGRVIGDDFTSMTPKLLEDYFVDCYAVTGATKQKAITFFLKAARFADIPLSPFLLTQIRNTSTRRRRTKGKDSGGAAKENGDGSNWSTDPTPPSSTATTHKIDLVSGGTLTVSISANPFKMPPQDREFVFSLIDKLQQYESEHPPQEEQEEADE